MLTYFAARVQVEGFEMHGVDGAWYPNGARRPREWGPVGAP